MADFFLNLCFSVSVMDTLQPFSRGRQLLQTGISIVVKMYICVNMHLDIHIKEFKMILKRSV